VTNNPLILVVDCVYCVTEVEGGWIGDAGHRPSFGHESGHGSRKSVRRNPIYSDAS